MNKLAMFSLVVVTCIAAVGCQKKETAQSQQPSTATQEVKPTEAAGGAGVASAVPAVIAGKTVSPGGKGNVELLNKGKVSKVASIKGSGTVELEGWAVHDDSKSVPETVVIQLASLKGGADLYAVAKRTNKPRPDLVKFFNEPSFKSAGFMVTFAAGSVPTGDYHVKIIQVVGDKAYVTGPTVKFQKAD